MTNGLDPVKTLLQRLVHVGYVGGGNLGELVQAGDPPLDDLGYGDRLIDSTAHGLQHDFRVAFLLEERGGVGDGVSHLALGGDAYFIVLDLGVLSRLLDLLVLLHFFSYYDYLLLIVSVAGTISAFRVLC